MTYAQAKLLAVDFTETDWRKYRDAAAFFLGSVDASDDDLADALVLIERGEKLRRMSRAA